MSENTHKNKVSYFLLCKSDKYLSSEQYSFLKDIILSKMMQVPAQHRLKHRVAQWKLKQRKKRKRRRKRKKRKRKHLRMPQKLKRRSGCKDYLPKATHTTTTQKLEVKATEDQVQI